MDLNIVIPPSFYSTEQERMAKRASPMGFPGAASAGRNLNDMLSA
jgi:hypothetical protein